MNQMGARTASFGAGDAAPVDRREQRERDRALGLVPFAVKLNGDLVAQLQALAKERGVEMNQLVDEVLRKGTFRVIDAAFGQRRKMLRQALSSTFGSSGEASAALESVGIDPTLRGEQLDLAAFVRAGALLGLL